MNRLASTLLEPHRPAVPASVDLFLRRYASLFARGQSRHSLNRYVTGLLADLPRKNCVTIAAAVGDTTNQRLQRLLTDADWDVDALDERRVRWLAQQAASGLLVIGETAFPGSGDLWQSIIRRDRTGVPSMIGAIFSPDGECPLPIALDLWVPEAWCADPELRRQARLPDGWAYRSKTQIVLDLIGRSWRWNVPFGVVLGPGYGDPILLDALDARGIPYLLEVDPAMPMRVRTHLEVLGPADRRDLVWIVPAGEAQAITRQIPAEAWQPANRLRQVVALRVERETAGEGWLLADRPVPGESGAPRWYFSNLPASVALDRLVHLTSRRGAASTFFDDARIRFGIDDYEGRHWHGLQRHLALASLAYSYQVTSGS